MSTLLLNTIALEPNRWTEEKIPKYRLIDLLPRIAAAGFSSIEIWDFHVMREGPDEIHYLRKILDELAIQAPVLGLYPVLHLDAPARELQWDRFRKAVVYAQILGMKGVKIFVGNRASASLSEDETERSYDFLRRACDHLQIRDMWLSGETHPDTLCDTTDAIDATIAAVDRSNFVLCYQPFDFSDTAASVKLYEQYADRIKHIHLQGRKEDKHSLLQDAEIDYGKFFTALQKGRFDGYLCIEFVKDCVVQPPAEMNLATVLQNAAKDRAFVIEQATASGLELRA